MSTKSSLMQIDFRGLRIGVIKETLMLQLYNNINILYSLQKVRLSSCMID